MSVVRYPPSSWFQFQSGAITSFDETIPLVQDLSSFNSNLVRLRAGEAHRRDRLSEFQFQSGAITSVICWNTGDQIIEFQFQSGAITRKRRLASQEDLDEFQFQSGAITR